MIEDKNKYYFPFTPISNAFIENYLTNINPSFVIIYIYLLKESFTAKPITADYIANNLQILQADVFTALNFWKDKGILDYKVDKDNFIKITFFEILSNNLQKNNKTFMKHVLERPEYTKEEMEQLSQEADIIKLFRMAERIFAKTFSYTDRQVILSFYNWLELPLEVLAVLFTYCAKKNKTNTRYIEKVAIDWADKNINTVKKAEEYINIIDNDYK